jgi:hypothetical protein
LFIQIVFFFAAAVVKDNHKRLSREEKAEYFTSESYDKKKIESEKQRMKL